MKAKVSEILPPRNDDDPRLRKHSSRPLFVSATIWLPGFIEGWFYIDRFMLYVLLGHLLFIYNIMLLKYFHVSEYFLMLHMDMNITFEKSLK